MGSAIRTSNGQFQSGSPGGPGRPKGARNKLGAAFIDDIHAAWEKHGRDALDRMIKERPGDFVKVVAHLMPKDLHMSLNANPLEDLTDDELREKIRETTRELRKFGLTDAEIYGLDEGETLN